MNLILLHPEDFISDHEIRISGSRLAHIRKVLKINPGDCLSMGIVNGPMGKGKLIHREKENDIFAISCTDSPPAPIPLTLVLALPRPKVFRRILQSVTALGVKHIILLHSFRVEKSYWQSPFLSPVSISEQCTAGLQQAKDTIFPTIDMEPRFRPFVEDRLPLLTKKQKGYVAHPHNSPKLPTSPCTPAILAIGPEGGFIPFELDLLSKAGMQPFSMGDRILSVETAVSAFISKFM
ncbi:16S rRNA (uracil(1498)-N(3))-methyltransferase [Desulfobotulus sp.]|uniref:16S rRNA (uracil(1498)-N(3))-methyltransferase n=1 Tax=Desulfobotulus sp. TaxID=1940337 RepID=UPI002A36AC2F|nr:16S rRNA (uracil(1498)-N(3))-methyltransferase [Desulfobotulus sp.]MDY0163470.1 16S rRNA (uracil(1498)-N(3))-methyltransferase [Desulfobotulus sp.]